MVVGKTYNEIISIIPRSGSEIIFSKSCADQPSIPPERGVLFMGITMKSPDERPKVKLVGENGNAFSILGTVSKALKKAGADKEYIDQYLNKAMSGDYDHLLGVTMEYVDVC
jgi:hypothetical protein